MSNTNLKEIKEKKIKTLNKQLYQHMGAGFGINTFLHLVQAALGLPSQVSPATT